MRAAIHIDQQELAAFCREWQVTNLALFGSVLREDFAQQSDVDVLVSFAPGTHRTLADLVKMEGQLAAMFGGRKVDLVTRRSVEASENYIRRKAILTSAEPIYAG